MQIFETLNDPKLTIALKQGLIGVLPTDTVYGIVCLATNKQAVERLYAAKHRDNKPGTLLTSSANQPGETPATNIYEAQNYFGETVDFYVDGQQNKEPVPSTLVRLTKDNQLELLRQGAGILNIEGLAK